MTESKKPHKSILVIDDEQGYLDNFNNFFSQRGYEVHCALGAPDALNQYHKFHPDLVIADYQIPNVSGCEIVKRIRKENPRQRVVMMTCHEVEDVIEDCRHSGAKMCISKNQSFLMIKSQLLKYLP